MSVAEERFRSEGIEATLVTMAPGRAALDPLGGEAAT